MLGKEQRPLGIAARAETAPFARKSNELRVVTLLAASTSTAMCEDAAGEIAVERIEDFAAEGTVAFKEDIVPPPL